MRDWLRETHGTQFELLRHFLLRFFDSEIVTAPGQTSAVLIAVVSLCLPWFQVLIGPIKQKYAYLSTLAVPGPYREAVRADELWLLTLVMSLVGLLTAIKWQSLFPDIRDYRNLGALPLRARQIFVAKLLALMIVAAAALILVNGPPSTAFPALSASRWAFHSAPGARMRAYALASLAGSGFFFFALIALQGVLLNLLPPRAFGRLTGFLQGLLVGLMLALLVLSFSIQPQIVRALIQPPWAAWLPPVWFLGLCQSGSGDPDPFMHALAHRGLVALLVAIALALCGYFVSYRRHSTLLLEGAKGRMKDRRSPALPGWLLPDPRQHAVVGFILQTVVRSSRHRMMLMGYGGLAGAVVLSGVLGMGSFVGRERLLTAGFIYFHVIALLFLLLGARHLFSIPTELKANWLFQITEAEGRSTWLQAVDRFVLFWFALLILAPVPLEIRYLGWRGLAEPALLGAAGLLAYEWTFSSWSKLPFTCSHLPGKTPGWILAIQFFALLTLVPLLNGVLLAILQNPLVTVIAFGAVGAAWTRVRGLRQEGRSDIRLKYEELPDAAVHSLNLLRG